MVLENIKGKTKSPYQERPNMDQKWSAGSSTGTLSGPWSNAFNGDPTTYAVATAESVLTLDTPIDISGKTVETLASASNGEVVKINGITITTGSTNINSSKYVDNTAELSGETQINTISIGGSSYVAFKSIKLDGQELVDGPADNSQNWSSSYTYSTNNNNPGAPIPLTRLFNGSLERPGLDGYQNTINTWTFNPIDISGKTVELYGFKEGVGSLPPAINGVSIDNFSTHGVLEWIDVTSKFTNAGVTSISEIVHNVGTQGPEIVAIKLDGAILVDAGAQWDTSQVWSDQGDVTTDPGNTIQEGSWCI